MLAGLRGSFQDHLAAKGLLKNPNFSGSHEVQERVAVTSRNLYFIYTQIILILDYKITLSLTPLELGK